MNLTWGYKFVGVDLTTDDHRGGRWRYQLGAWNEAEGPFTTGGECPSGPGDGLCVATTLAAAQSGGLRVGACTGLLVGYEPGDVLGEGDGKVRVRRLWVHPDPFDPVRALTGPGADLYGAYLTGAYLAYATLNGATLAYATLNGATLVYANLAYANLAYANLNGTNLTGAYLTGANLTGAVGNDRTVLPEGWHIDPNGRIKAGKP